MIVSAYATRLGLTMATVPSDRGTALEAVIEAPKDKVATEHALHFNCCRAETIDAGGGAWPSTAAGSRSYRTPNLAAASWQRPSRRPPG